MKRASRRAALSVCLLSLTVLVFLLVGWMGSPSALNPATAQRQADFAYLVRGLKGAVVHISTVQTAAKAGEPTDPSGEKDPFSDFWRRFFGGPVPRQPFREESIGSGVMIDPQGYLITNHHVIENAEKILVKLSDEREFNARVVGKDPKTDIALIKIESDGPFPIAPLGNSDQLEVGEWVLAIGNPFGLDSTVTAGIVSAKGRNIGAGPYDDFIQTDASINPGNSGGPLINMRGEIIGINTAIFSQSGGNIGIGFATPINLVKEILPELKSKGKVSRGWLGVSVQQVTPEIAESLGLDKRRGALVAEVSKDGPADRGGVKVGDVILELEDKEVKELGDISGMVARTPAGKRLSLKLLRDKKVIALSVTIGELKEKEEVRVAAEKGGLGLTVENVTPEMAESSELDAPTGVVVTSVAPGSPADDAGLERGDVILEVNREPVHTITDYQEAMTLSKKDKGILFLVRRGEESFFAALKPSQ